jgi:RNA polymerase sigma factor (sigma-70 family)
MKGSTNRGQDVQPVSNSVDTDAHALTVAITRGDREALGQLFDRYYTMMLNECRKSSGTNSILAEDAAQEAWLRVARRPVECSSAGQLAAWLRKVAMSASIDLLRSELARRVRERAVSRTNDEAVRFLDDHDRLEEAQIALMSLERDTSDGALLLALRTRSEVTVAKLAKSLGIGASALDSKLRRAAAQARATLEGQQ